MTKKELYTAFKQDMLEVAEDLAADGREQGDDFGEYKAAFQLMRYAVRIREMIQKLEKDVRLAEFAEVAK